MMKKQIKITEELNLLQTNINNYNKKNKYDNLTDYLTYNNINSNS